MIIIKRILIVDDAAFMRLTLKMMLEKNGFEVVDEAENSQAGVGKYKKHQPDLVTMDITMPELSGIDALKAIKKIDPDAKVIMVSAMGQQAMIMEAIKNGAKSFIVKPFKEDHLIKTLNGVLAI